MTSKAAQRDARRDLREVSRTDGDRVTFLRSPAGAVWWTDTYTARPAAEALAVQVEGVELPAAFDVQVGKLKESEDAVGYPAPPTVAANLERVLARLVPLARRGDLVPLKPTGRQRDNGAGIEAHALQGSGILELLHPDDADLLDGDELLTTAERPAGRASARLVLALDGRMPAGVARAVGRVA